MKKIFKIMLPLTAIGSAVVPVAVSASCGNKPIDLSKTIVIYADKKFSNGQRSNVLGDIFNNAVAKWQKEFPAEANKFKVIVKNTETDQNKDYVKSKTFTDENVSDIFFIPTDQYADFDEMGAIMNLSTAPGFEDVNNGGGTGDKFGIEKSAYEITTYSKDGTSAGSKIFGIPVKKETVESIINLKLLPELQSIKKLSGAAQLSRALEVLGFGTAGTLDAMKTAFTNSLTELTNAAGITKYEFIKTIKTTIGDADFTKIITALTTEITGITTAITGVDGLVTWLKKWNVNLDKPTDSTVNGVNLNTTINSATKISPALAYQKLRTYVLSNALMNNFDYKNLEDKTNAERLDIIKGKDKDNKEYTSGFALANDPANGWHTRSMLFAGDSTHGETALDYLFQPNGTTYTSLFVNDTWASNNDTGTAEGRLSQAWHYWYKMARTLHDNSADKDIVGKYPENYFYSGHSFATIEGPWKDNEFVKHWTDPKKGLDIKDLVVIPMSKFNGRQMRHFANGWGLSVNQRNAQYSEKTTAIAHIIQHFTGDVENLKKYYNQIEHFIPTTFNPVASEPFMSEQSISLTFAKMNETIIDRQTPNIWAKWEGEKLFGQMLSTMKIGSEALKTNDTWEKAAKSITDVVKENQTTYKW